MHAHSLHTQIRNGLVKRGFALLWKHFMLFDFICPGSWNFWRPFLRVLRYLRKAWIFILSVTYNVSCESVSLTTFRKSPPLKS